ncbi:MAG: tRNA (adenosine(37)-N6)-threonylcarbamoyltransferase complex ATPase subunit type 1 TsaE [Planctomycetota bacterium]|jgi:tRNA threonylcarbamoyladenosine biosynthesis protein TsaE
MEALPKEPVTLSQSAEATMALGERLAAALQAGDLVALEGDLGAGKTVFVRGVGRALGVPERDVRSPTFLILSRHDTGRLPLVHIDAYRLSGAAELEDLGPELWQPRDAAVLIEWPSRVTEALPPDRLEITIDHVAPSVRRVAFRAGQGARGQRLLAAMTKGE